MKFLIDQEPLHRLSEDDASKVRELCSKLVTVLEPYAPHVGARAMGALLGCNAVYESQIGHDDLSTVVNRFTSFITSTAEMAVKKHEREREPVH